VLLDGFQKIGLRHRPLRQAYAHKILMSTHAEDLSELKSYLDDGPDYHTTFKLLYSDFQVIGDPPTPLSPLLRPLFEETGGRALDLCAGWLCHLGNCSSGTASRPYEFA